jgi:hypothetical protein
MLLRFAASTILALIITLPTWAGSAEDQALRDAALALDIEGVKVALKKGANANSPSPTGRRFTPLGNVAVGLADPGDMAARHQTAVGIAKLLFAAGASLGPYDRMILYFPISFGSVDMVQLLIDKGASVTDDLEGYTPTQLAKKYGQIAVYDLLITRGGMPVDDRASIQLALVEAASQGDIGSMERAERAIKVSVSWGLPCSSHADHGDCLPC